MAIGRFGAKVVVGLAAFGASAMALSLRPAQAQMPIDTLIQAPAAKRPKAPPPRRAAPEQVGVDDPEAAVPPAPAPQPEEGEEPQGEDEPRRERSLTPTGGDAGRDLMPQPQAPVDGVIEDGSPTAVVVDGLADLNRDARRPEDIASFNGPPSGYDALAFQVEALDPFSDRRVERLFRFEPYDPVGIRAGSFVIFPEAELGVMTNSNLFRSSRPSSDFAYDTRGNVRAVSDWRTHALEFRATGRASFFEQFPSEDDRTWSVEARGRLDITRRTNIEAALSHQADQDVRALIDAPTNAARRGDVTTDRAAATLNQQFGRVTLQLRGALSDVSYAPVASVAGPVITNDSRNYTQRDAAIRLSYALNRSAAVYFDTALREREYTVAAGDGILRSSTSDRYRVGLAFSPLGPRFRGEIGVGWGQQTARDARLPTIDGYLLDANLAWRASALTSVLLVLRSEFYDTTANTSPGSLSREVGLEVRHAFQKKLIGTTAVRYAAAPYVNLDVEDKLFTGELGLDYYLNSNVSIYGRFQHLDFQSTDASRNYLDDIFRVGVRIRQ